MCGLHIVCKIWEQLPGTRGTQNTLSPHISDLSPLATMKGGPATL